MDSPALPRDDPAVDRQLTPSALYTPLSKDEIRLAVLPSRRSRGEGIEIHLATCRWPPSQPYEALSYVWGDQTIQATIQVGAAGAPLRPYPVTLNLYAALQHLGRRDVDRILWIDALCIDQNNVEEKEQQVGKMDQIYQAALKVCVWLGPGTRTTERAMALVPMILGSVSDTEHAKRLDQGAQWALFAHLLQNDWFSRRWVVQEIALAKKATVQCGSDLVSWIDFSDAISLYQSWVANSSSSRSELSNPRILGASTLSFLSDNALRKDRRGNILERRWNLEDLLALLPMFQTKVPHDAVYAVLSVASDKSTFPPVDYSKPQAELFTEVFERIAESSNSLDIMFRPWAPDTPGARLPSFIAPVSRHTHFRDGQGMYLRRNADSLVGAPRRRIYAATPHPTASPVVKLPGRGPDSFLPSDSESCPHNSCLGDKTSRRLATRGVVCAFISKLKETCRSGIIPGSWLEVWRQRNQKMPDLWRVAVAGRSHDGTAAPNWYRRAFESVLFSAGGSGSGNGNPLASHEVLGLNLPAMIERSQPSNMADFLHRVSACVWEKRLLVSTREKRGYFGLVPEEAEPGDMICLMEGCSVPVVFRGKPMTELVLQALQRGLLAPEALTPATKGAIVSSLQKIVCQHLSDLVGSSLERLKSSFAPYDWEPDLDDLETRPSAEFSNHGPFPRGFASYQEPEPAFWLDKFSRGSLERVLTESVSVTLLGLPGRVKDAMLASALESFFQATMDGLVGHPTNAVLLPLPPIADRPSWADSAVAELFRPLFAQACAQAIEKVWRREAKRVLEPPRAAEPEIAFLFTYRMEVSARRRAFEVAIEEAWADEWEPAWAASRHRAAELWSGELDVGIWSKPLQDGLAHWTEKWIGASGAYGGEVIGECYVQGLMDGEWWNGSDSKEQESTVFIIG